MDRIKRRLSRTRSNESHVSVAGSTASKSRGRRGALAPFHLKKANLTKELQLAIKDGDATRLREVLDGGSEFEDFEEVNKAVQVVCEKGYLDLLATLIRFGASVNSTQENNMAPLHIAARHSMLSIMNLLASNGANINITTKFEKRTALHIAALRGKVDSVKFLIEMNSSPDLDHRDIYGMTPLHLAAKMDDAQIVKMLLDNKHKCDVNAYDNEGWTALHLAAEAGKVDMAQIMFDYHAQVDCQNKYGRTPLHWATIRGHAPMVRLLLQHRASSTLKDLHNKCSLEYCKDVNIKQMLKMTDSVVFKAPSVESTIGAFLKIDPRESFIRRLGTPLPSVINTTVQSKKKPDIGPENLDTIVEETDIGSCMSRQSSLLSEDEAFVDNEPSDGSMPKEKPSLFRSLFQSKTSSENASTISSRRNSDRSIRSDFESSYKSTTSSLKHMHSVNSAIDIVDASPLMSAPTNGITVNINEKEVYEHDSVPEEALMGKMQFKTMIGRIQRHQQSAESIINSISIDIAQAVTGRQTMSNEKLMNISNRLHKLQDMMFDFREENDRQATLIRTTMATFLDTIKKRLSPRDTLPVWIQQAFMHAAMKYLASKPTGWKLVLQKLTNVSEEKRSDMLNIASQVPDESLIERCSLVIEFALSALPESEKSTPLRGLLMLIAKCGLDPNSAQIILKCFIYTARSRPEESMRENLFTLSYRLGKDGEALATHLGLSQVDPSELDSISPSQRQEHNIGLISRWRQATVNVRALDCVYDLVEGLVVIGREDLLLWILTNQKRRALSSDVTTP